jgi:hypothetical protein
MSTLRPSNLGKGHGMEEMHTTTNMSRTDKICKTYNPAYDFIVTIEEQDGKLSSVSRQ